MPVTGRLFTLVLGFGTAGYLLAMLAPAALMRTEDYMITADLVNVGGLPRGAKVESVGVAIGRVGDVALVDDRSRLQIEITIALRLPVDSSSVQSRYDKSQQRSDLFRADLS